MTYLYIQLDLLTSSEASYSPFVHQLASNIYYQSTVLRNSMSQQRLRYFQWIQLCIPSADQANLQTHSVKLNKIVIKTGYTEFIYLINYVVVFKIPTFCSQGPTFRKQFLSIWKHVANINWNKTTTLNILRK